MTSPSTDRRFGVNAGAAIKVPVKAASTATLTLSGAQTVDGVALVTDDRVLVKNQTSGVDNGIYVVDSGTWTRAPDWDGTYDVKMGTFVYVTNGTTNGGLFYGVTTSDPITIGTTSVAFGAVTPSSTLTIPLPVTQGGTGGGSAIAGLSSLGVIQVTAEAGTANSQTGTIDALVTAFRADQIFEHIPSVTNTGATTITYTPSGSGALAAKNVFDNGAALVGGELVLGRPVLLHYDGTQLNIIGRGFSNETEDLNPDSSADFAWTYDTSAKLYKKALLRNAAPLPRMAISGLIQSNNSGDAVNDIDISIGSARDASDAANMFLTAAITKQSDAAWAVGSAAGGLDTGAVGNNDYYVWLIKRVDTGVVDVLFSLSSTAPTMPANYTLKRLIGWIKRVGGTIVAMHAYEAEGGAIEVNWDVPTLDVNLANTLTTARRTDAVKVPLNFSTMAHLNVIILDATVNTRVWVCCPDQTDAAPSPTAAPLANASTDATVAVAYQMKIRTSAAGLIAARADNATVDLYAVSTMGFSWARRN